MFNLRSSLMLLPLVAACGPSKLPGGPTGGIEVQQVRFPNKTHAAPSGDVTSAAVAYVAQANELTGDGDDWKVRSTSHDVDGLDHVRMAQIHNGVPVWGADVVVHSDATKFGTVQGTIVKNLADFDIAPTVDQASAVHVAKMDYTSKAKNQSATMKYARDASELVIMPRKGRDARLAWHVTFFTELQGGMPAGLWNYFIDAKSGAVLQQFNALDTVDQASGPGGNPKFAHSWNMELDVTPSGALFAMDTDRVQTVDMHMGTDDTKATIVTGPLDNISDAAIDDAHGYAEVTLNMLKDWQGYNSIDNMGFKIKSRVHYDVQYENAFWDGTQMTYGDGASLFYPLSGSIDVVAHEIDHGFTSFHSNLTYSGQSGGMNESFSDIAGKTAEWYYVPADANFDLGGNIFKQAGQALRYMCDPTKDGSSIDNAANYNDGLDVHYTSGVMNKAFCRAAKRLSPGANPDGTATQDGVKRASQAWYLANAQYWTAGSTFIQGCQGVMDAAAALSYSDAEKEAIRLSWADVGVACAGTQPPPTCDETLTTDSGEVASPNFPNDYPLNYSHTVCIKPASGSAAILHFTDFNTEMNNDVVSIHDATGALDSSTSGTTPPADVTSTLIAITFVTDGNVTASGWHATWTAAVANQAPTVQLTSPADGSNLTGAVAISADASDADGTISSVKFDLPDGTSQIVTAAPYAISWNSATVADGAGYTIKATSFDNLGVASTPSAITVSVQNAVDCIGGTFTASDTPMAIPDNSSTGITSSVLVNGTGNVGTLALSLHITHTFIGDLVVTLTSPDGTAYVVSNRAGGSADNIVMTNVDVTQFNGKVAAGTWTMHVSDNAGLDTGTLDSWSLAIMGNCSPPSGWSASSAPGLPTMDNSGSCDTVNVTTSGDASAAKLDISGKHDFRYILRGTLQHNGVTVDAFPVGTFDFGQGTFSFSNRPVAGLVGDAMGAWTFCLIDTDGFGDTGALDTWSVHD